MDSNFQFRLKGRTDDSFPSRNAFARSGSKQEFAAKILDYCKGRAGYEDVIALCAPIAEHQQAQEPENPVNSALTTKEGYVYLGLLKLGREKRYKIGKAVLVERRRDQISLQLPEDLNLVHAINTDDAYGIEEYWHRRFAAKTPKGNGFLCLARMFKPSRGENLCDPSRHAPIFRKTMLCATCTAPRGRAIDFCRDP